MIKSQEEHLAYILEEMSHRLDKKYRAGDAEHGGGSLFEDCTVSELLDMALEEIEDLSVYLLTIRRKLDEHPEL